MLTPTQENLLVHTQVPRSGISPLKHLKEHHHPGAFKLSNMRSKVWTVGTVIVMFVDSIEKMGNCTV